MAQDFAKQRNAPDSKRKRAVSKGAPAGNASWSWFFSGLMTGVIVSIAAYLAVLKLEEDVLESAQTAPADVSPEDLPDFRFGFYEDLTNAEVAVDTPGSTTIEADGAAPASQASATAADATSATPQVAAATEERPTLYLLQAGSFQNKKDAESRRASIVLLNLSANVMEGIVGGRTWYRVQVGPFAGRQNAEDARDILSGNQIESIPLLVSQ